MSAHEALLTQASRLVHVGLPVEAELVRILARDEGDEATPQIVRAVEALVDELEALRPAAQAAVALLAGAQAALGEPRALKGGAVVTGVLDEQAALDVLARLRAALGEP